MRWQLSFSILFRNLCALISIIINRLKSLVVSLYLSSNYAKILLKKEIQLRKIMGKKTVNGKIKVEEVKEKKMRNMLRMMKILKMLMRKIRRVKIKN